MLQFKKRANLQVNLSLKAPGELRPGDPAENPIKSLPEAWIDFAVTARCDGLLRVASACLMACVCAGPTWCQENGSQVNMYHGNGAEISVTVHGESGDPISEAAMVRLYRDGNSPSGQSSTSRGTATF